MTTEADFDTHHVYPPPQCFLDIVDNVCDRRLMHHSDPSHIGWHHRGQLRKRAGANNHFVGCVTGNDQAVSHRIACAISAVTAVAALPVLTTMTVATSSYSGRLASMSA